MLLSLPLRSQGGGSLVLHATALPRPARRAMLESMLRYYRLFSWEAEHGGRAFDATIASLRRRALVNLKGKFY